MLQSSKGDENYTDNNTTQYMIGATWEVQRSTEVQIKDQSLLFGETTEASWRR